MTMAPPLLRAMIGCLELAIFDGVDSAEAVVRLPPPCAHASIQLVCYTGTDRLARCHDALIRFFAGDTTGKRVAITIYPPRALGSPTMAMVAQLLGAPCSWLSCGDVFNLPGPSDVNQLHGAARLTTAIRAIITCDLLSRGEQDMDTDTWSASVHLPVPMSLRGVDMPFIQRCLEVISNITAGDPEALAAALRQLIVDVDEDKDEDEEVEHTRGRRFILAAIAMSVDDDDRFRGARGMTPYSTEPLSQRSENVLYKKT